MNFGRAIGIIPYAQATRTAGSGASRGKLSATRAAGSAWSSSRLPPTTGIALKLRARPKPYAARSLASRRSQN